MHHLGLLATLAAALVACSPDRASPDDSDTAASPSALEPAYPGDRLSVVPGGEHLTGQRHTGTLWVGEPMASRALRGRSYHLHLGFGGVSAPPQPSR